MLTEGQEYCLKTYSSVASVKDCFRIGRLRRKIDKMTKENEQIETIRNKELADRYEELGQLLDKYIV